MGAKHKNIPVYRSAHEAEGICVYSPLREWLNSLVDKLSITRIIFSRTALVKTEAYGQRGKITRIKSLAEVGINIARVNTHDYPILNLTYFKLTLYHSQSLILLGRNRAFAAEVSKF